MPRMEQDISCKHLLDVADSGFEKTTRENIGMTGCLHELVRDHPDFEVLCESSGEPYHFRYVPHTLAERQQEPEIQELLNRLNEEIVESVQRIGLTSVTTIRVQGRIAIQISSRSNGSSAPDIGLTFEVIARWGRLLNTKRSVSDQPTLNMEDSYV
jgi:glutamate/tyrosine decarboxylase-like PLP-dependent enzyme